MKRFRRVLRVCVLSQTLNKSKIIVDSKKVCQSMGVDSSSREVSGSPYETRKQVWSKSIKRRGKVENFIDNMKNSRFFCGVVAQW